MLEAKLAAQHHPNQKTVIRLSEAISIGGQQLATIGGLCSVESLAQMEEVASCLSTAPVQVIRGGVYKPRTSPYAFQDWGAKGLRFWHKCVSVTAYLSSLR